MTHRTVAVSELCRWGRELQRPECVLTTHRGDVFVPDWRGGITVVRMNGNQETWLARDAEAWLRPNGIALLEDGAFLIANLGDDGGIWRLGRDRTLTPFLEEVDGLRVPPANFVTVDSRGRTWISVSTRHFPRHQAWRNDVRDGFVILVDDQGARIVVDGLHYANEVRPDPSGEWLYIVETFGRRVSRGAIRSDGTVGPLETAVELGAGYFPDGFAFDASGGLWVTSLISNRLVRAVDGQVQVVLEDVNTEALADAEQAFASGTMRKEHLGPIPDTELQQLTSLAFGGPDRREVFLGCLHSPHIHRFRSDVAGL
jgi:sugar lactone lactonase YvrE